MRAYVEICKGFDQARVPYVIVGAYGINIYAESVGAVVTTLDCDFMLPPNTATLARAVRVLRRLGFRLQAGNEPLVDDTPSSLEGIVRFRANIVGHRKSARVDLALSIAGCRFSSLWKKHRRFRVYGRTIRVAPLAEMLRSKQLADRPKDRLFLETYRDALAPLLAADKKPKPRKKR